MENELRRALEDYNNFGECIIVKFNVHRYQTEVEIIFDYIWGGKNIIRKDLDKEQLISVQFHLVQELIVRNGLDISNITDPATMSWGMNEIALIRIEDDERLLKPYRDLPIDIHHAAILWGGSRRIDIIFSSLSIVHQ